MSKLIRKLENLNACEDAVKWVMSMNGDNPERLWQECERGDWMLWLIGRLNIDRKRLVLPACQCARLSLHLAYGDEARKAIETVEAWTRGEATIEEVNAAAFAAYAAFAANDAAAYAAIAAFAAADAADANAYAAAAYAAYAAFAANDADAYAARQETLKECANITRLHFNYDEVAAILGI